MFYRQYKSIDRFPIMGVSIITQPIIHVIESARHFVGQHLGDLKSPLNRSMKGVVESEYQSTLDYEAKNKIKKS